MCLIFVVIGFSIDRKRTRMTFEWVIKLISVCAHILEFKDNFSCLVYLDLVQRFFIVK